ncbi:hypothetical protein AKJ16_DCAP04470 [Drosera capensis]
MARFGPIGPIAARRGSSPRLVILVLLPRVLSEITHRGGRYGHGINLMGFKVRTRRIELKIRKYDKVTYIVTLNEMLGCT